MARNESLNPSDWLIIAEKDWGRVGRLLDEGDYELAGFCLQQAVEKFLKAYLLFQGWRLRQIHSLDTLIDDALPYDPSLGEFRRVCAKINAYYYVDRYPFFSDTGLTIEDVQDSFEQVKELVDQLREGTQ